MTRLKIVIPISVIVFIFALRVLNQQYGDDISIEIRTMIALGGALFSSIITYYLFPGKKDQKN